MVLQILLGSRSILCAGDDLSAESVGAISSFTGGSGFVGNGSITGLGFELLGTDDFTGVSEGAISTVTSGTLWVGDGSFV